MDKLSEKAEPDSLDDALKVLVVDDEAVLLEHLCDGLRLFGYEVCRAPSSSAALAELAKDPRIGVVMTDIRMPGGDGLNLAQEILAARKSHEPVEVILITGHASLEDATAAVRTGVCDLLRKPFRLAEASRAIAKAMDAARAQRQALREEAAREQRLAELEEVRAELEHRMNGQLVHSPNLSRRDDETAEDEMRILSHALRTPLNAIAGGADMISDAAVKLLGPGIGYLQQGVRQAIASVELVEQLHRLKVAGEEEPPVQVDLPAVLRKSLVEAAREAPGLRICTDIGSPTDPAVVLSMPSTVASALSHCIRCAIEWAPPGFSLSAYTLPILEDSRRWITVTILVADADERPIVPEGRLFPRGDGSLTRTHETLDFVIARRLLQRVGGTVTSWNEPGRAVALRIALPG